MQELTDYWKSGFDWPKQQAWMNSHFNNFKMQVRGLDLHFVHHRSSNPDATPLLLVHGWPGSFLEFQKIIPKLEEGMTPAGPCMVRACIQGSVSEQPAESYQPLLSMHFWTLLDWILIGSCMPLI